MNVLFVTCKTGDYIASCLWDGFQELVGEENVYDAVDSPLFHNEIPSHGANATSVCHRISAYRKGKRLSEADPSMKFDLMVLNACVTREYDWHFPNMLWETRMRPDGKVALVEGWDGSNDINVPDRVPVHAVFRRELSPVINYPYKCHCLMMSCPSRWFSRGNTNTRTLDVFYSAFSTGWDYRWDSCKYAFSTKRKHQTLISSCGIIGMKEYFDYLATAKLGLCPAGAGNECADCLRTWEVVARGAIPIFIGYPERIREPWFADDEYFMCRNASDLPDIIDRALDMDLNAMRERMQERASREHTTKARAKRILDIMGLSA
jgi:hypothetical protein